MVFVKVRRAGMLMERAMVDGRGYQKACSTDNRRVCLMVSRMITSTNSRMEDVRDCQ